MMRLLTLNFLFIPFPERLNSAALSTMLQNSDLNAKKDFYRSCSLSRLPAQKFRFTLQLSLYSVYMVRFKRVGFVVSYRSKDFMSLCADGSGFWWASINHGNV